MNDLLAVHAVLKKCKALLPDDDFSEVTIHLGTSGDVVIRWRWLPDDKSTILGLDHHFDMGLVALCNFDLLDMELIIIKESIAQGKPKS